jgi:hypothetical protein
VVYEKLYMQHAHNNVYKQKEIYFLIKTFNLKDQEGIPDPEHADEEEI